MNYVTVFLAFAPLMSVGIEDFGAEAVARYGLLGLVLCWFMLRADKRLAGIEHGMAGLRRTMLVEIMSRPSTPSSVRRVAREELRRVDPVLASEFPPTYNPDIEGPAGE